MIRWAVLIVIIVMAAGCGQSRRPKTHSGGVPDPQYARLHDQVEQTLHKHVIRAWFPRAVDNKGGFHPIWDRQWNRRDSAARFLVFEARMTWIAAQVAMHRPELRDEYTRYALHGATYLNDVMWDKEFGGFHNWVNDPSAPTEKHIYPEGFGLYAAAAAYQATKDPATLKLVKKAFAWIDTHYHDDAHGGYHEYVTREGKLAGEPAGQRVGGFIRGYKSMNSHIHMLEAVAETYRVWKAPIVRRRLAEMIQIVRDRIAVEPGCLNLWLTNDWRAVPDHDSFGHDVETAFLLLEAEEVLGNHDPKTLAMARMLVDHGLQYGFDHANGGLFDKGYAFTAAYDKKKVWWSQVETLNALLLMHERFGAETDKYWKAFLQQWAFTQKHMLDAEYGGIYEEVEADGTAPKTNKGHHWKAAYHDGRSFMLVADRLKKMSGAR